MSIIYTIGHSNKSSEELLDVLRGKGIERLIDVRTRPYSRWYPDFNREHLAYFLSAFDINYDWRGNNLGGLEANIDYEATIQWVYERSADEKIALLCSEGDYKKCHRYLMLAPDLERLGAEIVHLNYENRRDVTTGLQSLF